MPTGRLPTSFEGLNERTNGGSSSRFCTEPFWNAIKRGTTKYDAGAVLPVTVLRSVPLRSALLRSLRFLPPPVILP